MRRPLLVLTMISVGVVGCGKSSGIGTAGSAGQGGGSVGGTGDGRNMRRAGTLQRIRQSPRCELGGCDFLFVSPHGPLERSFPARDLRSPSGDRPRRVRDRHLRFGHALERYSGYRLPYRRSGAGRPADDFPQSFGGRLTRRMDSILSPSIVDSRVAMPGRVGRQLSADEGARPNRPMARALAFAASTSRLRGGAVVARECTSR